MPIVYASGSGKVSSSVSSPQCSAQLKAPKTLEVMPQQVMPQLQATPVAPHPSEGKPSGPHSTDASTAKKTSAVATVADVGRRSDPSHSQPAPQPTPSSSQPPARAGPSSPQPTPKSSATRSVPSSNVTLQRPFSNLANSESKKVVRRQVVEVKQSVAGYQWRLHPLKRCDACKKQRRTCVWYSDVSGNTGAGCRACLTDRTSRTCKIQGMYAPTHASDSLDRTLGAEFEMGCCQTIEAIKFLTPGIGVLAARLDTITEILDSLQLFSPAPPASDAVKAEPPSDAVGKDEDEDMDGNGDDCVRRTSRATSGSEKHGLSDEEDELPVDDRPTKKVKVGSV